MEIIFSLDITLRFFKTTHQATPLDWITTNQRRVSAHLLTNQRVVFVSIVYLQFLRQIQKWYFKDKSGKKSAIFLKIEIQYEFKDYFCFVFFSWWNIFCLQLLPINKNNTECAKSETTLWLFGTRLAWKLIKLELYKVIFF